MKHSMDKTSLSIPSDVFKREQFKSYFHDKNLKLPDLAQTMSTLNFVEELRNN